MSVDGPGREQLRVLAARLKEAGEDGKGFRRELMTQIGAAAKPLAREIASVTHLEPYMPDRYAAVLADDLAVTVHRYFAGADPRITVDARARRRKRKVRKLEAGFIAHPVFPAYFARGWRLADGRKAPWKNEQTAGMKRGFFSDPCEKAAPDIRDHVLKAMSQTARKIADGR